VRAFTLGIVMAGMAAKALASDANLDIEQLEHLLKTVHGETDSQIANDLQSVELTERLSDVRLSELEATLPGPKSAEKLTLLANVSSFLELPAGELAATPPPDYARQVALLSVVRNYVAGVVQKLPNFFATRDTTNYVSTLADIKISSVNTVPYKPFEQVDSSSVTVLYREGREMATKGDKYRASSKEVRTRGEFGPILIVVLDDAIKGHISWSHWEQGRAGMLAVFRYSVPLAGSHYLVDSPGLNENFRHYPAYHGEIWVNPADGSILRLTVIAEMKADDPMTSANLAVDYGPVTIGGTSYICPTRSVALSQVRVVNQEWDDQWRNIERSSLGPARIYLNDVRFTRYHLFRAESRILTGKESEEEQRGAGKDDASGASMPSSPDVPARRNGTEESSEIDLSKAGRRFSVSDLERGIEHDKTYGTTANEIAQHLYGIQLTERLSDARLAHLETELPGPEDWEALHSLYDVSAFLDLPEKDVPLSTAPDKTAQTSMVTQALDSVHRMLPSAPEVSATARITCFASQPRDNKAGDETLHKTKAFKMADLDLNAREALGNGDEKGADGLTCGLSGREVGELGKALTAIMADASRNALDWSHWEMSGPEREAVFTYSVPQELSKFPLRTRLNELNQGRGQSSVSPDRQINPGYHGEIAIDPRDGSVLRISLIAELGSDGPVKVAETMMEYAPVDLGGMRQVFPKRGVTLYEIRNSSNATADVQKNTTTSSSSRGLVYLEDVVFEKYRISRSPRPHLPN
jgi:hypothetical protein